MMRILRFSVLLGAGLLLALAPTQVFAVCPGISQAMFHGVGGFVANCVDNTPVQAYAFVNADPTVNSGPVRFACINAGDFLEDQSLVCQVSAGVAGDGLVTVNFNWGSPGGVEGCPNPTGLPGVGRNLVTITDNESKSAVIEVGYNVVTASYVMEAANNGAETERFCDRGDGGATLGTPCTLDSDCDGADAGSGRCTGMPVCNAGGSPQFLSDSDVGGGNREVCVQGGLPPIFSDCDTGANGETTSCVAPGDTESVWARADHIWSRVGACRESQPLPTGDWTDAGELVADQGCVTYASADLEPVCVAGDPLLIGTPCAVDAACDGSVGGGSCENLCIHVAQNAVIDEAVEPGVCLLPYGICISGPFPPGTPCASDADCSASVSVPGPSVAGYTSISGGPLANTDRAVLLLAELGKNVLKVEFTVSLEAAAVSFDVIGGGRVLNDSPILAENLGSYVASIDKAGGKLRGEKSISIRTNLEGGGTLMSAPLPIEKGNK